MTLRSFPIAAHLSSLWILIILTPALFAHDLQTKLRQDGRFILLEASYEGEDAASYLAVRVHAPDDGQTAADAFQTGRTDRSGRFVFLPSRPGLWKITVDDEMGHRVSQEITVADAASPSTTTNADQDAGGRTNSDKLVIGLSVLFGITGMLMAWMSRRNQPRPA